MNNFYHFIRENHILAIVDIATTKESSTLNLSHNDIKEIPHNLGACTCLSKLFLHHNSILEVNFIKCILCTGEKH